MKKFISIIILILFILSALPASAEEGYVRFTPYPYSSHILGEDLVIYGDTNLGQVILGLYYPQDQGYLGRAKYIITITAKELRNGYAIPTETYSRLWPEGLWKVVLQNGDARVEVQIPMTSSAVYNRSIRVAEYEDNILTNLTSYASRGMLFKNNIIEFALEDETTVRIFSWNNFAPTDSGETRLFVAFYKDGYLTNVKTYTGTLSDFGRHVTLNISENKRLELFYWNDNLIPIN